MTEQVYPTQILLNPEEHQALAAIAAREGRSIADVAQEMIRAQLAQRPPAASTEMEQQLAVLERIRRHREEILAENGGKPLDWDVVAEINQMRDERDAEIWAILTGDSG